MLEMLAIGFLGPHAAFEASERALIEAPLCRLLQRAGKAGAALTKYADPVMLAFGLAMWGLRVTGAREQLRAQLQPRPAPRPIAPPPPPVAVAETPARTAFVPAAPAAAPPTSLDYLATMEIGQYGN